MEGKAHDFKATFTLGACTNAGPNNIIAGDFNAHFNYWDNLIQIGDQDHGDTEGEGIENWMATGNTGTNTYRSNQGMTQSRL